ncbi:MAG: Uma2 family endonuclease [Deinococcota bacterium]
MNADARLESEAGYPALVLDLAKIVTLDDEDFSKLAARNPELRLERSGHGNIIIMPPVGLEGSWRNAALTAQVFMWSQTNNAGMVFDSSAGFRLPNGAIRSADVAWVRTETWNALSANERSRFAKLVPEFVIELRSASDRLRDLQDKMLEYQANGVQLGLLIDPLANTLHVYQQQTVVQYDAPTSYDCSPVLAGCVLDLQAMWS